MLMILISLEAKGSKYIYTRLFLALATY